MEKKYKTTIVSGGEKLEIDFKNIICLPNELNNINMSIANKLLSVPNKMRLDQMGLTIRDKTKWSKERTEKFNIKAFHSSSKKNMWRYYEIQSQEHFFRKILIPVSGNYSPYLDNKGDLSQTILNVVYLIKDNEEGKLCGCFLIIN